jgi:hypothetical protein
MPELNGFETATIIYEKDKLKNIPIISSLHLVMMSYIFKGYRIRGATTFISLSNPSYLRMEGIGFVELYRKNQQLLLHEKKLLAANRSCKRKLKKEKLQKKK